MSKADGAIDRRMDIVDELEEIGSLLYCRRTLTFEGYEVEKDSKGKLTERGQRLTTGAYLIDCTVEDRLKDLANRIQEAKAIT